ncbi:cytochrome P450 2A6-like [Diadema antillarum]|uniref:cytochrome P450 2A6-like n=2 Tax=Diadema antillarum TaxID=105358 RepID=UPI003A864A4C
MAGVSSTDTEYLSTARTVVALTFCVVLLVEFLRWVSTGERARLPPGPRTLPFPLNLVHLILSPRENRMELLMTLKQKYGELCCVDMDGRAKVIINSPDLARELFVKLGEVTSNRLVPRAFVDTIQYSGGIVFSHGQDWLALRRYSLSALRNFGMGKRSIESRINEEARMLLDVLADRQDNSGINPADYLNNAVSNVICSITFGERFECDDPAFLEIVARVKMLFGEGNAAPVRLLVQKFPGLMRFNWPRKKKMIKENIVGLKDFIVSMVEKHDESFDENDIRDIIDMYLAENRRLEADNDVVEPYLGKGNIWMCVFDLFLGGTETTSTALIWFFLIMASRPEIQMKVADEINSVIGQERAPLYEDRKRMPYTQATLSEILRFRPVAPFGLPHFTSEDVRTGDYVIPKGHEVWVNVIGIHHDPELFAAPEEFNPNRFLGRDGLTFTTMDAFIPFGLGRRSCLGEQLAKMELFLFATSILQRFVVRLPPGVVPDYSIGHRIRTLLPKDFNVCLSRR